MTGESELIKKIEDAEKLLSSLKEWTKSNGTKAIALDSAQTSILYNLQIYKVMTHKEAAIFQLQHQFLCMPMSFFHESVNKTVGYPVFTHEFGSEERLKQLLEECKNAK